MRSKRSQEGYLLIDNRNSPGVTPEFVHASGIDAPIVGPNMIYESATITCAHCGNIVILNPGRTRERGYCAKCDHYVCDNQICNQECFPFKKLLAKNQEQAFRKEQSNV